MDREMAHGIRRVELALLAILLVGIGGPAFAYTISSPLSSGCHEAIATGALRRARGELVTAAPLPLTEDEQAFVDDLPFSHERSEEHTSELQSRPQIVCRLLIEKKK